jgi:serine/threonine-protein kinase PknG
MTTTACTQPDCSGHILDGYCDICGSPAAAAGDSTAVPPAAPSADPNADVGGAQSAASAGDHPLASTMSRASSRLGSTALGSARTQSGSRPTRRVSTAAQRLRARRLGAGLTSVPPQPAVDASTAIMVNPAVAEAKRMCPSCEAPVGRASGDRPGRTEGFCPQCRNPYSFTPKLQAGDVVGNQYEVAGCLAHGGLGWIYLARDRNVSNRWVVLKGLLNSGDADALAAAIAEQQFLAQVEHPSILEIYNFATHEGAGYIVMEYIGGTSLKTLLQKRMQAAGHYDALPLDQAIAYILEVLPAFQYLHDLGLLYCDFKPDNIIQVGDDIKLIDLGAVRRVDDDDSPIYGTVGYQAPEVADIGPSIASDIYTIGRTLLVLAMEFRGYQSSYLYSLPSIAETPLFQKYDSFYRLIAKACATDPADRFASAAELRGQLLGVLREVVATDRPGQIPASSPSVLFEAPNVGDETLDWRKLPDLVVDTSDPQAGWLASVGVQRPAERLALLDQAPEISAEVLLDIGQTALMSGEYARVDGAIEMLLEEDAWEWRAAWLQGLKALELNDGLAARSAFNAVYGQVPGELAPKLALALACENSGELDVAQALYEVCARTDAGYRAPAAFGIARIRQQQQDVPGAVAALDLVPTVSRAWVQARLQRAQTLAGPQASLPDLAKALRSLDGVEVDPHDRAQVSVGVLAAALAKVQADGPEPDVTFDGSPATEPQLRASLETAYRTLATFAPAHSPDRIQLVDAANSVRGWSLR